jgi:hypothetical protein
MAAILTTILVKMDKQYLVPVGIVVGFFLDWLILYYLLWLV